MPDLLDQVRPEQPLVVGRDQIAALRLGTIRENARHWSGQNAPAPPP
jgi:hypothetical protein